MKYKKHFIPLESNPTLFTKLIHELGVSESLSFHDVWSLDENELLALIPRPVLALVIAFPTPPNYENRLADINRNSAMAVHRKDRQKAEGEEEERELNNDHILWFKQTINNACGLYGILHAVLNGGARDYLSIYHEWELCSFTDNHAKHISISMR